MAKWQLTNLPAPFPSTKPPCAFCPHCPNLLCPARLQEVWGAGCVTLIGDAAHGMLPTLGQGACQGIEDAVELATVSEALSTACCAVAFSPLQLLF